MRKAGRDRLPHGAECRPGAPPAFQRRFIGPAEVAEHDIVECRFRQRIGAIGLAYRPQSGDRRRRSEEHTSELQSLMRISYAVFCLKKKKTTNAHKLQNNTRMIPI